MRSRENAGPVHTFTGGVVDVAVPVARSLRFRIAPRDQIGTIIRRCAPFALTRWLVETPPATGMRLTGSEPGLMSAEEAKQPPGYHTCGKDLCSVNVSRILLHDFDFLALLAFPWSNDQARIESSWAMATTS